MYRNDSKLFGDESSHEKREVHIISYSWDGFDFELSFYDGEEIGIFNLDRIDFEVSQEKVCIGNFDGGYSPCPDQKEVDRFYQCSECAPENIPRLGCIFEPQGCEDCEGGFCGEEHVVYLVFQGVYPKVGMTRSNRLKERLIEQGADAYAVLETVENRKKARKREKELSRKLNISQRTSSKKKLEQMSRNLDQKIIKRKYRGVKNQVHIKSLKFLEDYPISLPLRTEPRLRSTSGLHRGDKIGLKGEFLIYENNGLQALNLSDVVGRKVLIMTDRD